MQKKGLPYKKSKERWETGHHELMRGAGRREGDFDLAGLHTGISRATIHAVQVAILLIKLLHVHAG